MKRFSRFSDHSFLHTGGAEGDDIMYDKKLSTVWSRFDLTRRCLMSGDFCSFSSFVLYCFKII